MALLDHEDVTTSEPLEKSATFNGGNTASQLIYQLVRVEEDGTVIPASEDEVIEVESYFEGETPLQVSDDKMLKDVMGVLCKPGENVDSSGKCIVGEKQVYGFEADRKKLLAQLAFLEALLLKLKDEEQECRSFPETAAMSGSEISKYCNTKQEISSNIGPNHKSDTNSPIANTSDNPYDSQNPVIEEVPQNEVNERDMGSPSSTSMNYRRNNSNGTSSEINPRHEVDDGEAVKDVTSVNASLEKLSIRELHELYQRTFGRHTSVKDKQWLIRRIAKGLGASSEALDRNSGYTDLDGSHTPMVKLPKQPQSRISMTGKGTKKRSLETSFMPDVELKTYQQKVVAEEKSPDKDFSYLEPDHRKQSPGTTHQFSITNGSGHILNRPQTHSAQDEGKRKRKPTRRYIEELTSSDTKEVHGKVNFLAAKEEKSLPSIRKKHHFYNEDEDATREVTDLKFRTGYRSRGRPKKSGALFLNSCSSERAALLVRKALSARTSRFSGKTKKNEPRANVKDVASDSRYLRQITNPAKLVDVKLKCPEVESDVHVKGENQKKNHHPWTLKEVMKLLEGVTHCGVGKWADIKKFSFSAIVYRSSTDLKDKWRNLVRASNTHYKMLSQGEHQRKKSASPIPVPILVRVHELAVQRYQSSSNLNANGSLGHK